MLRVPVASRVGAGGDGHAQLEGPLHAGHVMRVEGDGARPHVRRGALAVVHVHGEGGHEEGALRGHLRHQGRLLVQVAPVLDRIDSRLEGGAQPGASEGVAHHPPVERVRFGHEGLHLLERERGVEGP